MRFLLHPRSYTIRITGATSYVLSRSSNVKPAVSSTAATSNAAPLPSTSTGSQANAPMYERGVSPPPTSTSLPENTHTTATTPPSQRRVWGQQCSPLCGCVVRFEAEILNGTIESASYHAKQVVLARTKSPPLSASQHQPLSSSPPPPVLTAKGRPMLQACDCETLHRLSAAVLDHMVGSSVSRLKNSLEFHSVRSSASFRHAVLRAQGLPVSSGTKCFDLVEEAVTALLKGHLPRPRPRPLSPAAADGSFRRRGTASPPPCGSPTTTKSPPRRWQAMPRHAWRASYGSDDDDGGEEEGEEFPSVFWWPSARGDDDDDGAEEHGSDGGGGDRSRSSALRMFDLEHERTILEGSSVTTHAQSPQQQRRRRMWAPRDWVSYVDDERSRREESPA